jgi:hypothetical protein
VVPRPLRTREELCGVAGNEREGLTRTLDPARATEAFGFGATRTLVPSLSCEGSEWPTREEDVAVFDVLAAWCTACAVAPSPSPSCDLEADDLTGSRVLAEWLPEATVVL